MRRKPVWTRPGLRACVCVRWCAGTYKMVALSSSALCGREEGSYRVVTSNMPVTLARQARGACFFAVCVCAAGKRLLLQLHLLAVRCFCCLFVCSARVHRSIISLRHASLHLTHTHSPDNPAFCLSVRCALTSPLPRPLPLALPSRSPVPFPRPLSSSDNNHRSFRLRLCALFMGLNMCADLSGDFWVIYACCLLLASLLSLPSPYSACASGMAIGIEPNLHKLAAGN